MFRGGLQFVCCIMLHNVANAGLATAVDCVHLQEALNAVANKAEGVKAAALKALEEAEKAKAHKAVEEAQRAVNKAAAYALVTRDAAAKKTAEKRNLLKKAEAMEAEELAASSAQRMP